MRCPQSSPSLRLTNPLVKITVACIQTCLDAHLVGIAARFPDIAAQMLQGLAHLLVRFPLREPPVAQAGSSPQQHLCSPTQPYRNGAAYRQWIEPSFSDGMESPFVADNLPAP